MRLPSESVCRKFLLYTFAFLCFAGILVFAGWILFSVLLPFVLAWGAAFCVQPMVRLLHRRTGLPRRLLGVFFALIVLAAAGTVFGIVIGRLLHEVQGLCTYLSEHQGHLTVRIAATLSTLQEKLPLLKYLGNAEPDALRRFALTRFQAWTASLTGQLPALFSRSMRLIPECLLFAAVLIMAVFCFCGDFTAINGVVMRRLPEAVRMRLYRIKSQFVSSGKKVLRAYAILFCITFAQLLAGLLLLRIPYAFAIALCTACLDILPVFGVGTVLIPWGIWSLLLGNTRVGWGLLLLYLLITLLRQVLEPRVLGGSIGLPPLATLIALYAGYRLCGVIGMLIFPLGAILLRSLLPPPEEGRTPPGELQP